MKIKKVLNNSGVSILEVIVAILIITVGMVGVLSLVIQNIRVQYIDKNILIASSLAQEGVELIRNIRDLNWLTPGNLWNQGVVGSGADYTYAIDYGGRGSINLAVDAIGDAGAKLYTNSDGFYTHTSTGNTATAFSRLITVVDNINYLDVKCTIRWSEGTQNHDYTAETYLYDWK